MSVIRLEKVGIRLLEAIFRLTLIGQPYIITHAFLSAERIVPERSMNTVELFSGIGGFRLAADRLSIKTVWANDNCEKACLVYRTRFGSEELREADIQTIKDDVPAHGLLTGGFPCQPFSSAGKKKGIRDPRGTLFEAIVDILHLHQPRVFILENVKRLLTMEKGLHFATILNSLAELNYRIEWRLLNAMHFGLPQNRQRVFIVGIREEVGAPGTGPCSFRLAAPADLAASKGIHVEQLENQACWRPIERHGVRFPSWGMARAGRFSGADLDSFSEMSPLVTVGSVLQKDVTKEFDFTNATLKWLDANTPVNRFVQGVQVLSNQAGGARMGYTIFGIDGVAPTLTSTTSRHYERYKIGDRYRRLTNIEYARIQGFPDEHCSAVSAYDQYALLGNAVPPPMVEWVMRRATGSGFSSSAIPRKSKQMSLFDHAHQERA